MALLLLAAIPAVAQPPAISRWTGSTATAQPFPLTQGSPLTLTWGFMAPNTPINDSVHSGFANGNNNLQTFLNGIYGSQAVWQPHFQSVFNRWSSVSGLTYVFEPNDDGAVISTNNFPGGVLGVRADLRIGGKVFVGTDSGPVLAYNYFPNTGEMMIDTGDGTYSNTSSNSLRLRNIVSHEHGHGIGMSHVLSNNGSFLMEPFLTTGFDGPQYHDILMAQRGYGDFNEKSTLSGNDVFSTATGLGAIADGGSVSIGNDARNLFVGPTEVDFVSIDDTSDQDFYSFSVGSGGEVNILLESLGLTYNITNQAGAGNVPFNAKERSDLTLQLLDTNGTSVLQTSNSTGLGGDELIVFNLTGPGIYFARVSGVNNADFISTDTQFYGLSIGFSAAAVPEPSTVGFMIAVGLIGALSLRRRRRRKSV
jgi:hypothetical protein